MLEFLGFLALLVILGSFAWGAVSAAPYVPLRSRDIIRLLNLADVRSGETLIDLGCGDGRIILTAAKVYNLKAKGFEIAFLPWLISLIRKLTRGAGKDIKVSLKNFWQADLSKADIVVCFLTPPVMGKLEAKLKLELKPGARFVTYAFPLPNLVPTAVSKPLSTDINIYLYKDIVRPVGKVVDI